MKNLTQYLCFRCLGGWGGPTCDTSPQQLALDRSRRLWTGVGVSVVLLMLVAGAVAALIIIYRRRGYDHIFYYISCLFSFYHSLVLFLFFFRSLFSPSLVGT